MEEPWAGPAGLGEAGGFRCSWLSNKIGGNETKKGKFDTRRCVRETHI